MSSNIDHEPYVVRQARMNRAYRKAGGAGSISFQSIALEFNSEAHGEELGATNTGGRVVYTNSSESDSEAQPRFSGNKKRVIRSPKLSSPEPEDLPSACHSEMLGAASRLLLLQGNVTLTAARVAVWWRVMNPDLSITDLLVRYHGLRRSDINNALMELAATLDQGKEPEDAS